jgi:acetate kinase
VRETRRSVGAGVPHAVSFDTAFHRTMPDRARYYAIPPELAWQGGFQRYGFHGLAHRSMLEVVARRRAQEPDQLRLVTLQLGSGCSAAAIDSGRSIDTSMGLTPLEGLPMATRSGDVDPSLVALVAGATGRPPGEVVQDLNARSGLLGVSGLSSDVRVLLDAEAAGHEGARLALEMFCYRVRKQVGAYVAALGGADGIVFGGGIGENAPVIRRRVCEGLEWCGVHLDSALNEGTSDTARISRADSAIEVWVAAVDEESLIAREAYEVLRELVPR